MRAGVLGVPALCTKVGLLLDEKLAAWPMWCTVTAVRVFDGIRRPGCPLLVNSPLTTPILRPAPALRDTARECRIGNAQRGARMDLKVKVDDMDDAVNLIHVLDEASRTATENGNEDTAEVLADVANQIRGHIQGHSA